MACRTSCGWPGSGGSGQARDSTPAPRRSPAPLARSTTSVAAPLQVHRLIDHQHGVGVLEVFVHALPHVVTDSISIPGSLAQQVLHPLRGRLADPLGDRPAVLRSRSDNKPRSRLRARRRGFDPGEPARDLAQDRLEKDCRRLTGSTLWPADTVSSLLNLNS